MPPKTVAFLTNSISFGGVEVALYDYADCNETILGNKSIVITRDFKQQYRPIYEKFEKRFEVFYIKTRDDINAVIKSRGVDVCYSIKSGERDVFGTDACKCVVHCVFTTTQPHGHVYAAIHPELNRLHRTSLPVVPHMIRIDTHTDSFRGELGISADSLVVGRYGSAASFDLPFVHEAVIEVLNRNPTMWFVCMATNHFATHPRLVYLPVTTESYVKRKMINTCDVMLHARHRGETFGLSCGEFSVSGKPFLTWAHSPEKAHIENARGVCCQYSNKQDIIRILESGEWKMDMSTSGYLEYTPEKVMSIFDRVFLR
jgi:hypothetical protein